MSQIILPSTYLGNTFYFSLLLNHDCVIDTYENYRKRSWRNRCDIAGPGGILHLTAPVRDGSGSKKIPLREMMLDDSKPWRTEHWRSVVTCYAGAPYFEHYQDQLRELFLRRTASLLEWNHGFTVWAAGVLGCAGRIAYSENYIPVPTEGFIDMRNIFVRDRNSLAGQLTGNEPYFQVFSDRYEFLPGLSILDLVMNEGPYSAAYLRDTNIISPGHIQALLRVVPTSL